MSITSSNTQEFTYDELMERYTETTRIIEHLKFRIAELERDVKWREESISTIEHALANNEDDIEMLESRIAELEEKQRWIPVSERLPDNWKLVLTIAMSERVRVPVPAFYDPETSLWSTRFTYDLWVTHWMPLPPNPESPNDTQTQTFVYGKESEE